MQWEFSGDPTSISSIPPKSIPEWYLHHYNDVIMSAMASQITSLAVFIFNRLFRRRSKKISKLRVIGHCEGNITGDRWIPRTKSSNAKNVPIWWRHYVHALVCVSHFLYQTILDNFAFMFMFTFMFMGISYLYLYPQLIVLTRSSVDQ